MIDKIKLKQAATQWLADWNDRHIPGVMSHYADDVTFYSPTVVTRWNVPSGQLVGKDALEKHFRKGMEAFPDMHFSFHDILYGAESIILFYKRENGLLAADFVSFDQEGRVKEVRSHWTENGSTGVEEAPLK